MTPRPSLDHFVGQEVVSTRTTKDHHKIELESGATIYSSRKLPDGLRGKRLTQVIMSQEETRLIFFDVTVSLHPTNYMIETEDLKPFHPSLPQEIEEMREGDVPDPSADRIFAEPTGDVERSVLDESQQSEQFERAGVERPSNGSEDQGATEPQESATKAGEDE